MFSVKEIFLLYNDSFVSYLEKEIRITNAFKTDEMSIQKEINDVLLGFIGFFWYQKA